MGNPMGVAAAGRMGSAGLSHGKLLDAAAAAAGMAEPSNSSAGLYTELLPAGCAPDAYKLFVGNVPKTFTEEELRPVSVCWTHVITWHRVVAVSVWIFFGAAVPLPLCCSPASILHDSCQNVQGLINKNLALHSLLCCFAACAGV